MTRGGLIDPPRHCRPEFLARGSIDLRGFKSDDRRGRLDKRRRSREVSTGALSFIVISKLQIETSPRDACRNPLATTVLQR